MICEFPTYDLVQNVLREIGNGTNRITYVCTSPEQGEEFIRMVCNYLESEVDPIPGTSVIKYPVISGLMGDRLVPCTVMPVPGKKIEFKLCRPYALRCVFGVVVIAFDAIQFLPSIRKEILPTARVWLVQGSTVQAEMAEEVQS